MFGIVNAYLRCSERAFVQQFVQLFVKIDQLKLKPTARLVNPPFPSFLVRQNTHGTAKGRQFEWLFVSCLHLFIIHLFDL